MSPKELLYLEDALGQQNPQLKQCVAQWEEKHAQLFQKLYGLM